MVQVWKHVGMIWNLAKGSEVHASTATTFREVVRIRHLNAPPVVNSVDIADTTSQ